MKRVILFIYGMMLIGVVLVFALPLLVSGAIFEVLKAILESIRKHIEEVVRVGKRLKNESK